MAASLSPDMILSCLSFNTHGQILSAKTFTVFFLFDVKSFQNGERRFVKVKKLILRFNASNYCPISMIKISIINIKIIAASLQAIRIISRPTCSESLDFIGAIILTRRDARGAASGGVLLRAIK